MIGLLIQTHNAIHLEAEAARLNQVQVSTDIAGYSGNGYVSGFSQSNSSLAWTVTAKPGIYQMKLRYATPNGPKGIDISVNGRKASAMLPNGSRKFETLDLGKVELTGGSNEIRIERGWGYYEIDALDLVPAGKATPLKPVPNRLTNANASPETKALFKRLTGSYGKQVLSGGYGWEESRRIQKVTGDQPLILGADFMDYSPSRVAFGTNPKETEQMLASAKKGQILTISWHWNAPTDLVNNPKLKKADGSETDASWYKGFYTEATTFDVQTALADKNSERYRLILRDIDAIAVQLKRLQAAKVPVLWRPLHEAEGGWFWWGAKGPKPCLELWRLLRSRLEGYHHLNNLIWVWNSTDPAWYPGDDQVDIVAVDQYPSDHTDPLSGLWESLLPRFNGKKMLAIGEFPGPPDVARMSKFGVQWAYFVSWSGMLPKDDAELARLYAAKPVITLKEWVKR